MQSLPLRLPKHSNDVTFWIKTFLLRNRRKPMAITIIEEKTPYMVLTTLAESDLTRMGITCMVSQYR